MSFLNLQNLPISPDFKDLLIDFVWDIIDAHPNNIYQFAYDFFTYKMNIREQNSIETDLIRTSTKWFHEGTSSWLNFTENAQIRANKRKYFIETMSKDSEDSSRRYAESSQKSGVQREILKRLISRVGVFKTLDALELEHVIDSMQRIETKDNDVIMSEGEAGLFFYIIQSGIYESFKKDGLGVSHYVNTYVNQGYFGEVALLYNKPRGETVICKSHGILWTIDKPTFKKIVILKTNSKQLRFAEFLNNVELLKGLTSEQRMLVADSIQLMRFENDDIVIKQNSTNNYLYLVESGLIHMFVLINNQEKRLKMVETCGSFGEKSLMGNGISEYAARSVGVTYLARIDRETFKKIILPFIDTALVNEDEFNLNMLEIESIR